MSGSGKIVHNVSATVQLKGHNRARSQFEGGPVPSTGETSFHVVPGLRLDTADRASLYLFVQVPLYRHVNEQQLAASLSVMTGFSKSF